jgi:hypothetical protein
MVTETQETNLKQLFINKFDPNPELDEYYDEHSGSLFDTGYENGYRNAIKDIAKILEIDLSELCK